jgi:hypothetical protein
MHVNVVRESLLGIASGIAKLANGLSETHAERSHDSEGCVSTAHSATGFSMTWKTMADFTMLKVSCTVDAEAADQAVKVMAMA